MDDYESFERIDSLKLCIQVYKNVIDGVILYGGIEMGAEFDNN